MRIAYLEDDAEGAATVGTWLREAGYELKRFVSGMECARVVSEPYDACLLGGSAEDLSVIEVMTRLRVKLRQAMPPILFLAGRGSEQDMVQRPPESALGPLSKRGSRSTRILLSSPKPHAIVPRRDASDALPL